jgi:hypothetical protein
MGISTNNPTRMPTTATDVKKQLINELQKTSL